MLKTFRHATVAATLGLAAFAPAATAGTDEKITVKGGWVEFEHRGEHLTASDTNPSHKYSVRAYLDWKDSRGRHTAFVTSWQGNSRQCSLGQAATA